MKKRKILLIIAVIICMAVACASVSIKATRDPAFTEKLRRIYVVIDHGELDVSYSEKLKDGLTTALSQKQIQFKIWVLSPLDLDENAHKVDITTYGPQAILRIVATGSKKSDYGGLEEVVYDVSVVTPSDNKRVWRAQTKNSGGTAMMGKRLRKMADRIVKQLADDGIIE